MHSLRSTLETIMINLGAISSFLNNPDMTPEKERVISELRRHVPTAFSLAGSQEMQLGSTGLTTKNLTSTATIMTCCGAESLDSMNLLAYIQDIKPCSTDDPRVMTREIEIEIGCNSELTLSVRRSSDLWSALECKSSEVHEGTLFVLYNVTTHRNHDEMGLLYSADSSFKHFSKFQAPSKAQVTSFWSFLNSRDFAMQDNAQSLMNQYRW